MATYIFSFPPTSAGLPVVVRDADGNQVATATAGQPNSAQGAVVVTKDLDVGEYVAEATNDPTYYAAQVDGVLDVPETIFDLEAQSGGGLSAGDISATSPATWSAGSATIGVNVATVATSGAYSDLTGRPSIPSNPGDIGAAPANHTHTASDVSGLATVATSGSYSDLSNKPSIPTVPVAAFVDVAAGGTLQDVVDSLIAAGLMASA